MKDTTKWGLHALVVVADIDRAIENAVTWEPWEVLLLHGLLGHPASKVAEWLGTSERTVYRRYEIALEEIQVYLNGGL